MNEIQLKYGCNPNQKPSRIYMEDGGDLPVKVLNGKPSSMFHQQVLQLDFHLQIHLQRSTG